MQRKARWKSSGITGLFLPTLAMAAFLATPQQASASFIGVYDPSHFTLLNSNADGSADASLAPNAIRLIGGNNGSGFPGATSYTVSSALSGLVSFHYAYSSLDLPGLDLAGYLLDGLFFPLANIDGSSGDSSFAVTAGQTFGFRMQTIDNQGEPGVLTVSSFSAPVPEPATGTLVLVLAAFLLGGKLWQLRGRPSSRLRLAGAVSAACIIAGISGETAFGQTASAPVILAGTVNVSQAASAVISPRLSTPSLTEKGIDLSARRMPRARRLFANALIAAPLAAGTPVGTGGAFGFPGLTHRDQRLANGGNQFSLEPPDQGLAVGNGYVVEAVNNGFQIYSNAGTPLLPQPIAMTQVFGLPAEINQNTHTVGTFLSDPRAYFDQDSGRFFVVEWAQLNDAAGNALDQSREYIAVSQTGNPTGTYNIYTIDTTLAGTQGCPCIPDYPQVGADNYGLYISSNEFSTSTTSTQPFAGATIRAISKAGLIAGAANPSSSLLLVSYTTGYEFTIHPVLTPPGANYFLANGGVEYFVSSFSGGDSGSALAVWSLSNTSSLNTATPQLALVQTIVPTQSYTTPNAASQKPGPLPYGSALTPPGVLPQLDGGDQRIQSAVFSGGRLYATVPTQVTDGSGASVVGAAYFILSPTYRAGTLSARVLRQGYVAVNGNNLLRPAIAVNAQGRGAMTFTLVGPGYFPSAAFVPINNDTTGSVIQIAGAGTAPDDGFTGYPSDGSQGVGRWGDYAAAAVDTDGSIWMATEYIPGGLRTSLANWGTFLFHIVP